MHLVRRHDIDDIDVVAGHHGLPVGRMLGDSELGCEIAGKTFDRITDGDDLATRIALPAGNVGHFCPAPGAEDSDTKLLVDSHSILQVSQVRQLADSAHSMMPPFECQYLVSGRYNTAPWTLRSMIAK